MKNHGIRLGVIGCGQFAQFAVEQFIDVPGTRVTAVTDVVETNAVGTAERFGAVVAGDPGALATRADVDLVYVATPPALHHRLAMLALEAGKHVIVEKPLALALHQADEMIETARRRNLLIIANLMQRYNPNYDAIERLIRERLLGELLHAYFENYATDEMLPPDHWFWDRSISGGIFIEHGVHFFDLFAGWLGAGEVEAAQHTIRRGTSMEDQVQCTVRYPGDVLVNYYHGFHQAARMDRQEMRLVFERGDVILEEWVPTRVRIHAAVDDATDEALRGLWPDRRVDVVATYDGEAARCRGHDKPFTTSRVIDLTAGGSVEKMQRYGELVRALFADQLAWIRDPQHTRTVTEENGRSSLIMAINADRLSHHCAVMSRTMYHQPV
jgi:predicted dehydrogenase